MENATKALLIAAAVLVTILVIALGVGIVNQGDAGKQAASAGNEIVAGAQAGVTTLNTTLKGILPTVTP